MPFDISQLLKIIPASVGGFVAGKQGGKLGAGVFMSQLAEEVQKGRLMRHQLERDRFSQQMATQAMTQREAEQQFLQQNREADNARMDNELQAREQQAKQRQLMDALTMLGEYGSQQAETAPDAASAESAMLGRSAALENTLGIPSGQLAPMIPNMAPAISSRKRKQAEEIYERALKRFGPEALESGSVTLQTGELFGDIKPADLRAMFETPAVGDAGISLTPLPTAPPRAVQTAERMMLEAWARERGKKVEQLSSADLLEARKAWADSERRGPTGGNGAPRTLTPNASLAATQRLRNTYVRETAAAKTVITQLELMKASMDAVRSGSAAAGSQGVLVTFQKILDPGSVVRESEYARSASGQSLLSQLEGQWMRISRGGAGVPADELQKFVGLAEKFAEAQIRFADESKAQIDAIANQYGLDPALITKELGAAPAAKPNANPLGIR